MAQILEPEEQFQVPSALFNFLIPINKTPYRLEIEALHDGVGNPQLFIRSAEREDEKKEKEGTIKEQLKSLEGMEAGK